MLWQEVTERQHVKAALGSQALSAWRLYRLRSAWATWADRATEMAAKRAKMQTIVGFWRNRALAKAFMPWHAEVMRSRDLEALLATYTGESNILCPHVLLVMPLTRSDKKWQGATVVAKVDELQWYLGQHC